MWSHFSLEVQRGVDYNYCSLKRVFKFPSHLELLSVSSYEKFRYHHHFQGTYSPVHTGDCHRKRRLSPKTVTVAEFGDYSHQCGQGLMQTHVLCYI